MYLDSKTTIKVSNFNFQKINKQKQHVLQKYSYWQLEIGNS